MRNEITANSQQKRQESSLDSSLPCLMRRQDGRGLEHLLHAMIRRRDRERRERAMADEMIAMLDRVSSWRNPGICDWMARLAQEYDTPHGRHGDAIERNRCPR